MGSFFPGKFFGPVLDRYLEKDKPVIAKLRITKLMFLQILRKKCYGHVRPQVLGHKPPGQSPLDNSPDKNPLDKTPRVKNPADKNLQNVYGQNFSARKDKSLFMAKRENLDTNWRII